MTPREYIDRLDKTQAQVARDLGYTPQHLSAMLCGTAERSLKFARRIVEYTGGAVTLEEALGKN